MDGALLQLISADGTPLVARRTGHGTPVVFVHGSAGSLESWDPVLVHLGTRVQAWVYARRGYPPSGGSPRPKRYGDDVADLVAVVDAVGVRPHLVGASYGATVAMHALLRGAVSARTLTIFEPPLFAAGPDLAPTVERYRQLLAAGRRASAARLFAEQAARMPHELLGPTPDEQHGSPIVTGGAVGCLHDLEAMAADTTPLASWAKLLTPAAILRGELTWEPMPSTLASLLAIMPASTHEIVLNGQSHFATHTAPAQVADAIREVLARDPS